MKELKFKPLVTRFRATFASGGTAEPRLGKVDREAEVLHDVQITLEGEARGHGVWLDRAFCEDVAKAGNATGEAGVKVRFGHPAMCSDALGTYLGRAKNFRVVDLTRKDGSAAAGVIADIHLAAESHSAPKGDLGKWVLDAAENSPDTFGQSIVFTYADLKVKDADGNDHSYNAEVLESEDKDAAKKWREQSADGKTYVVLGKLHGTDFTDTPAATDGVFSEGDLAAEAERMLDENPQIRETLESKPDSVFQFLTRIGILDKLESKRVSNLQAEKDREIAALKSRIDELVLAASEDAKRFAALEDTASLMKNDLQQKTEALAAAQAEASSFRSERDQARSDLAELGKQHAHLKEMHDALTGAALNPVGNGKNGNSWGEAYRAARNHNYQKG